MNATRTRPRGRYHKLLPTSPYLIALRHLCSLGWTDERMAAALTLLSVPAICALEGGGWDADALEQALDDGLCEVTVTRLPWTVDQVRYYRRLEGRKRQRPPTSDLVEAKRIRWRIYQHRQGWGRLLPDYVEPVDGTPGHWLPGHELSPRAVQILQAVREHAPVTAREIARRLGLRSSMDLYSNHRYLIHQLMYRGLLIMDRLRRLQLHPAIALT